MNVKKAKGVDASKGTDTVRKCEAEFHDDWAKGSDITDVKIREAFESPVSMENRFILSRMGELRGRSILDVGAGLGESSVYFALAGAKVTAADLSPEMIELSKRLATHHGAQIDGIVCPGEALAAPDDSFDFVYAANVIHHVTDKEAFFREACRVLKPGGLFFSWDPLRYNPAINVYRRMATSVRTDDEEPLGYDDVRLARQFLANVSHREFWITTLSLFLKYYLIDRVHPNEDRYWKRILKETPRSLWWWYPLSYADKLLTRTPLVRRLAWNMVMWGRKL